MLNIIREIRPPQATKKVFQNEYDVPLDPTILLDWDAIGEYTVVQMPIGEPFSMREAPVHIEYEVINVYYYIVHINARTWT